MGITIFAIHDLMALDPALVVRRSDRPDTWKLITGYGLVLYMRTRRWEELASDQSTFDKGVIEFGQLLCQRVNVETSSCQWHTPNPQWMHGEAPGANPEPAWDPTTTNRLAEASLSAEAHLDHLCDRQSLSPDMTLRVVTRYRRSPTPPRPAAAPTSVQHRHSPARGQSHDSGSILRDGGQGRRARSPSASEDERPPSRRGSHMALGTHPNDSGGGSDRTLALRPPIHNCRRKSAVPPSAVTHVRERTGVWTTTRKDPCGASTLTLGTDLLGCGASRDVNLAGSTTSPLDISLLGNWTTLPRTEACHAARASGTTTDPLGVAWLQSGAMPLETRVPRAPAPPCGPSATDTCSRGCHGSDNATATHPSRPRNTRQTAVQATPGSPNQAATALMPPVRRHIEDFGTCVTLGQNRGLRRHHTHPFRRGEGRCGPRYLHQAWSRPPRHVTTAKELAGVSPDLTYARARVVVHWTGSCHPSSSSLYRLIGTIEAMGCILNRPRPIWGSCDRRTDTC